jgi:hypothetical protein
MQYAIIILERRPYVRKARTLYGVVLYEVSLILESPAGGKSYFSLVVPEEVEKMGSSWGVGADFIPDFPSRACRSLQIQRLAIDPYQRKKDRCKRHAAIRRDELKGCKRQGLPDITFIKPVPFEHDI